MLSGNGLAITYTTFNKPATIQRGSNQISFDHDTERGRFRQISSTGETLYLNSGMRVEHSASGVYTRYFHKDHLGSISTITDESGTVVERLSYDAWGKRRNIDGTDDPAGVITSQTTRGFTGHEQLAEVGLVHMNGRVYDPLIGRFGSADPMTEAPYSTQGWNRYAYVGNSPLNFNDPTGFCFMGCFWQKPFKALGNLLRSTPIVAQLLQVAGAIACGPGAFVCVGLVSAAITGIASGDLGQALKAGVIAAATAAAMFQVGELTGSQSLNLAGAPNGGHAPLEFLSEAHVFNMAGHAAVGCGSAAASGGECGAGALSGVVGSFAGPLSTGLSSEGRLIVATVSGGVASVAGGGKFGNGAVTAAFGYLYNEMGTNRERGYDLEQETFGECLSECTLKQFGLNDVFGEGFDNAAGRTAVAAGAIPIPKRWVGVPVLPGTSPNTNGMSVLGHELYKISPKLEPRMSFRFLGTTRLFGMAGRAIPFVGVGIAIYDAASISHCTYQCTRR